MPTVEKQQKVAVLAERLSRSQAVVLTSYQSASLGEGLDTGEITSLRRQLQEAGADYHVVKNTLFKLALAQSAYPPVSDQLLTGPTAVAFCQGDVVEPLKRLIEFARTVPLFTIKGGIFEGRVLSPTEMMSIASLPPRGVLLSQVLGGLQAPLTGLVNVLAGPLRGLVNVLEARKKQLEEQTGISP